MAVYTHLSEQDLREHLRQFDVGELVDAQGVSGGTINTIYDVNTTSGRYILRILEDRSVTDARFEENLIIHLSDRGLVVPRMIETNQDGCIISITPRQQLSLFEYLPGREVAVFEVGEDHARQIGKFLGRMHVAAEGIRRRRRNRFSPERVTLILQRCIKAMEGDPRAVDLERISDELKRHSWPRHLKRGIIHGDLFIDNARFHQGTLCGVLDFEMASMGPLAYDVAVAIADWCFAHDQFMPMRARALVSGYLTNRAFSEGERDALFALCRYAICRFTITRFYDFEVRTRPEAQRVYKDYRHFMARMVSLAQMSAEEFAGAVFADQDTSR